MKIRKVDFLITNIKRGTKTKVQLPIRPAVIPTTCRQTNDLPADQRPAGRPMLHRPNDLPVDQRSAGGPTNCRWTNDLPADQYLLT